MTKKPEHIAEPPDTLDDHALQVLMKEYDALRDLYTQAESSAQGMFNFYLSFVSTVIGAFIVLYQARSLPPVALIAMLFFVAVVGTVYLSALIGRYAHMARYARGVDAVRRVLMHQVDSSLLPSDYAVFTKDMPRQHAPTRFTFDWLFPTGTFQFFVALMTSLQIAVATWLILSLAGAAATNLIRNVVGVAILFLIIFTLYNIYSHLIFGTLTERLGVRLDTQRDLPLIAGKQ